MKVWKRCMAAALAFVIFAATVTISEAAGTYDTENYIWTADNAAVVAGYYGLDAEQTAVLSNNAVDSGLEYTLFAPYDNETEGKKDLVAIDYINKKVYADALHTEGYSWLPVKAVIRAEGEVQEELDLAKSIYFYNEVEYDAAQAFTYSGYSYTVEVTYQLMIEISEEEQNRILQIPVILAQTAVNLEENLVGIYSDVKALEELIPALARLLTLELPATEEVKNEETGEIEEVETTVPVLDPEEEAETIGAIEALQKEFSENEGLILRTMSEQYSSAGGKQILAYTFENGARLQELSGVLYDQVFILRNSSRLRRVLKEIQEIEPELYTQLKNMQTTLRNLAGTATKASKLAELKEASNWTILDENVRAQIFADTYTEEDFAALESAVFALRHEVPQLPVIETEQLLAAEMAVGCSITIYDVSVSMNAAVPSGQLEDGRVYELETYATKVTLLAGTTKEEIRRSIETTGIEKTALEAWNAQSSEYQINTANYDRSESSIPEELHDNVECVISYTPKYYSLKTNFRGDAVVPYGFRLELPRSTDEEVGYDYVVETEGGSKISYNEGVTIKITQPITITQQKGAEKTEYRLYDFLINDVQYAMTDAAKQILASAAVESPTLRIRVPDGSTVGEVTLENGVYRIEAADYSAGILGMHWVPKTALVMQGDSVLEEIPFENNGASWTTADFTHVKINYVLKIEKVSSGAMNRPLDETADVLYALNLPHDLVTHTVGQNRLFCSEKESAKTLYTELAAVEEMMTVDKLQMLAGCMKTDEEKDAMLRLMGSEDQMIQGQSGQDLGYGAWNNVNNELALYTYLRLCADTNWSLAAIYKEELYEDVAEQAGVLADCLEVITAAPGLWKVLELAPSYKEKMEQVVELLPKLRELSEQIDGPHQAINVKDESYEELITLLLESEGKTVPADSSTGIYAYASIRRNNHDSGSLTVSVQVGSRLAKTKELSYLMEGETHALSESEAARIAEYIAQLEAEWGMTEAEKAYYDWSGTPIPQAGTAVGKNEVVSLIYTPKEYTVTIKEVPSFEASFKYKSDYVIELPPYSDDPEESKYYCYWIDAQTPVKVPNGSKGYYAFTKEDLTTRFVDGCFEMYGRQEIEIPKINVTAAISLNEELLRGYEIYENEAGGILYLDVSPSGLKKAQFEKLVTFTYGDGKKADLIYENSNRDPASQDYLANGTKVHCRVYDENENVHETTYTLIFLGDVNKNGKIDINDVQSIAQMYLNSGSSASGNDITIRLAADMNFNENPCDSNDALLIMKKILYWNDASEKKYVSVLMD